MRKLMALLVLAAVPGVAAAQAKAPVPPAVKVKESAPGLLAKARVTPEIATRTALARVPKGAVKEAEIEREKGLLVYSFDIAAPGKTGVQEVQVDAISGKVVAEEHESAESEAREAASEKKAQQKKAAAKEDHDSDDD